MGRFDGKVAIVLGASESASMGGVIATRLRDEGATTVIAGRNRTKLDILAADIGATAAKCDITREADVSALARLAMDQFGRLDIAVNCVGEAIMGHIEETDEAALRQATDLHFIGPFFFIKHMAACMRTCGSIVTLSSITASLTFHNHAAYMGAKAGTDHIVRVAALEYGPRGIKVNSVSPGFTETPMTTDFLAIDGVREAFESEIPLGRLNTAADVAAAVLWLSSDEAFMTGQNLHPSGGNTLRRLPTIQLTPAE